MLAHPLAASPSSDVVPARYARGLIYAASMRGADPRALLAASGLSPEAVEDADGWVPGPQMLALWDAAVEATGDPDLGLHIGSGFHLTALSIVGYGMMSAPTLGDAFGFVARYYALAATGRSARLDRGGFGVPAALEFVPVTSGYPASAPRQPFEVVLAAVPAAARALTGRALPVEAVACAHARPPTGTAAHREVFGVEPTFDAPCYRVAFAADALGWRVRSASPALHASFARKAERALARVSRSMSVRVQAIIEARLNGSVPTLQEVAGDLAMSERSLQRYLEDEDTSFQALCDDVRRARALHLLESEDMTLHEVAYELGYSAPSAFHRAFKRWTGQTPSAYRAERSPAGRAE